MTSLRHAVASRVRPIIRRHSAFIGSVVAVDTQRPEVVLSYDDGPDPGGTAQVLAALAEHGATATFFVLLTRARKHPSVLADVIAAGHEVALHGLDHSMLTTLPAVEVRRRCLAGKHELEDLAGVPIRWLRPPYGHQTLATWRATRASGLEPVLWGRSSGDSQDFPPAERLRYALTGVQAGDILLGHDGFATVHDGADDGPEPAVDRYRLGCDLMAGLRDRGLEGVSLGNALLAGTPLRAAWFKR
ncbi:polysaccharide deacetylase family protein [Arthrobacter sp. LAPM80]|uniref:polysaccharide deacetylase family protein n=1 Tax=Arthrobacter sp. LAPM80 TaxID=3141788 RepID=UPI00398B1931